MDLFTKNLMNSSSWNTNKLNKHWLILDSVGVGSNPLPTKVRYFVLNTIDSSTSAEIKTAITTSPNNVIFNSSGDLQWGSGKIIRNILTNNGEFDQNLNIKNIKDSIIASISTDPDSSSQIFYYDENDCWC